MSEIQRQLSEMNESQSFKLVCDLINVALHKEHFFKIKRKPSQFKIRIKNAGIYLTINCTFKNQTYVKESITHE